MVAEAARAAAVAHERADGPGVQRLEADAAHVAAVDAQAVRLLLVVQRDGRHRVEHVLREATHAFIIILGLDVGGPGGVNQR